MKTLKKNKFLLAILFAVFAAATAAICLCSPSNKSARAESLVQETFVMEDGVSAKLSLGGGVRFRVKMDSATKDNILNDSQAELQIIVAPESYFNSNVAETNGVKITVDKQKIYKGENDDFYYANGCITDIKVDNRTLNLKAIAKIVKGTEEVGKTAVNDLAVGNMRDVLVSAVLDASGDYEKTIAIMPAYSWFGTEDYPITITSLDDYNALVKKINGGATEFDGKFATYSEAFRDMEGATALESGKTAPKGIYSVILESNGGSVDTLNKYVEGTAVTLPTPTKTGHNFMGWFISSAFDGEPVTEISAGDYGNKTFYAKWEIITYQVKFLNADGSVLKEGEAGYGTVPEYAGTPTIASNRYVYTFNGWNKELTAVTGEQLYVATYTKADKQGEIYSSEYNSSTVNHVFESTRYAGNGEWTIRMSGSNFYQTGGVLFRASNNAFVTLRLNAAEKKVYFYYDTWGLGIGGSVSYTSGDGASPVDITFKFVKTNDRVIGYVDGVYVGDIYKGENTNSDVLFDSGLDFVLETYRDSANAATLTFDALVVPNDNYAIDGAVADTATEFGVTAAGNFTFTAAIQGAGLYTYAGIRIRSGENFIDIYSHTYGGNQNFVRFNGWNVAENGEGKVNIANNDKAVYKVVKTDEKMSFYLNDILVFEFDKTYHLAWDWGNRFFTEGAVFSFGLYTEAGAGGTGYACDVNIDYAN